MKKVKLEVSERWSNECLSLPIHPNLSRSDIKIVVHSIKRYFKAF